jgi:hypothetical protein
MALLILALLTGLCACQPPKVEKKEPKAPAAISGAGQVAKPAEPGAPGVVVPPPTLPPVYHCIAGCEGRKTYGRPGRCPICGKDLVPLRRVEARPPPGRLSGGGARSPQPSGR